MFLQYWFIGMALVGYISTVVKDEDSKLNGIAFLLMCIVFILAKSLLQ